MNYEGDRHSNLCYNIICCCAAFAFNTESIVDEIKKMKEFDHRNVLNLKGVTSDPTHRPGIVMPFMRHGSLEKYLSREQSRKIYLLEDENSTSDRDVIVSLQRETLTAVLY